MSDLPYPRSGRPKGVFGTQRTFHWPSPEEDTPASAYLGDIAADPFINLPNHNPEWGFVSRVHIETGEPFDPSEAPVACRFSRRRTSTSPPYKSISGSGYSHSMGMAQGYITAERKEKDRVRGQFIRNPNIDLKLWRITASKLRSFTDREYARLQTFPDTWIFHGGNKRHTHQQIGNAVPVQFAYRIGRFLSSLHLSQVSGKPMKSAHCRGVSQIEMNI